METPIRIKICCIATPGEAKLAIDCGASAVGLVSAMPSGPGPIAEERISEIAAVIPPGVASFLLTCLQDTEAIIQQQHRTRANTIQLCDRLERGLYSDLRNAMPGIGLVQVVHVTGPESLEEARRVAPYVDAILLDSGNQSLAVKELGGTGRVHDWAVSRRIVDTIDVPVCLAGGLTPDNVAQAVIHVRPFGVDVCNGVRTNGALDAEKLRAFILQASRGRYPHN